MKPADRGGCQWWTPSQAVVTVEDDDVDAKNKSAGSGCGVRVWWNRSPRRKPPPRALAGVQAQILTASMLALWNRSAAGAASEEEVAARLFDGRTLMRLWGQRHTLHLYDARGLAADPRGVRRPADLVGTPGRGARSRAGPRRVTARASRAWWRCCASAGRSAARSCARRAFALPEALLSPWGGVFAELVRLGEACHARWDGGEARYAHRDHWLPDLAWTPPTADGGERRIWRGGFSAATARRRWRILLTGAARAAGQAPDGCNALAGELTEVEAETPDGERIVRRPGRSAGACSPNAAGTRSVAGADAGAVRSAAARAPGQGLDRRASEVLRRACGVRRGTSRPSCSNMAGRWRRGATTASARASWRSGCFRSGGRCRRHVGKEVRRQAKEVARFFGLKLAGVRIEKAGNGKRQARRTVMTAFGAGFFPV